jgi:hypothetical protein
VQNVPGVLMKQAEQTRGVPLAGLAVKVTPGFFLIGLSALETEMQRNLQLLKERAVVRYPNRLQQQSARHSGHGEGHAGRKGIQRGVRGLASISWRASRCDAIARRSVRFDPCLFHDLLPAAELGRHVALEPLARNAGGLETELPELGLNVRHFGDL